MKYYLAGPMSGIPQFNFPAFDAAAKHLRELGYDVISPAELDNPAERAYALASPDGEPRHRTEEGMTWGDFLARDVKLLADQARGIILMDGWYESRGALLEVTISLLCNHRFMRYYNDEAEVIDIHPLLVHRVAQGAILTKFFTPLRTAA